MTNWDDFQELFHKTFFEIEQTSQGLERMKVAFESLSKTYESLIKTYQEFIDYCKELYKDEEDTTAGN